MSKLDTKKRLEDLKQSMLADPVQLNSTDLYLDSNELPNTDNSTKYIDYDDEKKNHKEYADQVINNIITTYIKSVKLLESPRLKDLKQDQIIKHSRLLLYVSVTESNFLKLQESIDSGDMTKEIFDSVDKAGRSFKDSMVELEKHLDKCEKYWKDYAADHGLENTEEQIVQETEVKEDESKKRTIISIADLSTNIQNILDQKKQEKKDSI